jgi:uncharacterized protein (DUF1697 family)
MSTFAALLRGINVGGKSRVPMAELRSALSSLGFEDVVTYIQSGNVVFRSPRGNAKEVATRIEKEVAKRFGVNAAVLIRTPPELAEIADANPFLSAESDLTKLHVVFLDGRPGARAAAQLDPARSPPDEFRLSGREIYLHLPNGFGRSKLTIDYFERRLGATATARNWKTLLGLLQLTSAMPGGHS